MRLLLVVTIALLTSAGSCPRDPTCTPGTKDCACSSGNACNAGLSCESGTCKPASACTPGTLDCACTTAGTCEGNLVCNNATCRQREAPAQGTEGGPCYPNNTCNDGLQCTAGTCEDPACPVGSIGCPCGTGGSCNDALACQQGLCAVSGCTPGEQGCLCNAGMCTGGLQCVDNFCSGTNVLSLSVENMAVRACELVFEPGARRITAVGFKDNVVGEWMLKKGRTGVAFTARSDGALAGTVVDLTLSGTQSAVPSDAVPALARCVDRLGQPVASPGLTFH